MGGPTEYIFGVYHTVETPLGIWAMALMGVYLDHHVHVFAFPKPHFSGYTIGPIISFQDYVVGLIEIYQTTSENILDGRLGGFSENPA